FNSIDVTESPPVQNSAGTFRFVPALLSHASLSACSFDGYEGKSDFTLKYQSNKAKGFILAHKMRLDSLI
ncbi:hypothetical protein ACEVJL_14210, partial [Pseudoflavonifractor sp. P01025]|uniref:hypothetical protein n=1 Tax=Flintibacter porci TaxID=3342383 RepID=UPI0035B6130E